MYSAPMPASDSLCAPAGCLRGLSFVQKHRGMCLNMQNIRQNMDIVAYYKEFYEYILTLQSRGV